MTEPSAAVVVVQGVDFIPTNFRHPLHHQLGDTVTSSDAIRSLRIGVQHHDFDLTAIRAIDESWAVRHRHPMLQRQTTAREHESGVTPGQGQSDSRWNQHPASGGGNHGIFPGAQIQSGVTGMGVARQFEIRVQTHDGHDHSGVVHSDDCNGPTM